MRANAEPGWLAKKDYSYLCSLDAGGWLRELERCAHLTRAPIVRWILRGKIQTIFDQQRSIHIDSAHYEVQEIPFEEEWKGVLDGLIPRYLGPPPVEIYSGKDQIPGTICMSVWPQYTDAEIMRAFEAQLRKIRETHPSPARKPGPKALTGRFGEAEFKRWRNHKIVQISELLAWGKRESLAVSNADLGRWLFADAPPRPKRKKKIFRAAREKGDGRADPSTETFM